MRCTCDLRWRGGVANKLQRGLVESPLVLSAHFLLLLGREVILDAKVLANLLRRHSNALQLSAARARQERWL